MSELKQIIVVRTDIRMSTGKLAVQVGHASVTAYVETSKSKPEWAERWLNSGQKKVVVKVGTLVEMIELKRKAETLHIPAVMIEDAGLTELDPGTVTAMGLGPAPAELIDKVTGSLPLL
ncbi:MAG: peptidyl-tRNA hydrolase Pth2 [Thaumarchaeota archaeon]|nr:peptidyl-tRNA hydrolase Pth2 [Candidatus Calditenuaceae archaeon]MDW8187116.1 peptidyl-tRNA hydrolase Pth2 [Nitrososphaerota archaeon]